MSERIIFASSVEGMLRALGELTPELKKKLVALGVNADKLLPGYDPKTYLSLLDFIGAERFPEVQGTERDRALGREFIRGFGQTFVGKATLALGRVIGPMRGTQRLTRTMRTVNNYSESHSIPLTATSVQVWCHPVLRP